VMMSPEATNSFRQRYGRWAVVAGASEGVGACAADELAANGLDLVLTARNRALLEEVAVGVRKRHGVEATTLALDLTAPDAVDQRLDMSSEDVAHEIIENIGNGPTRVIGKLTSGVGPLAEPWSDFRRIAVATMINSMQGFTSRTTPGRE